MAKNVLRDRFKQSQDYKYEMLIRDLIEQAKELNVIIADQQAQLDTLKSRIDAAGIP